MGESIADTPRISIVVLNYNGQEFINDCVESLLAQSYINNEIIVIDNGSTDRSLELLGKFDTKIRLIINPENVGFSRGNNIGIKESKGEMIALVNNDTIVHPDWLLNLTNHLVENTDVGIATGVIYFAEYPNLIWCAGGMIDAFTGMTWHKGKLRKIGELNSKIEPDYIPNCGSLIRREVFEDIGMLNERYFLYSEDVEFSLRARAAGWKLAVLPSSSMWHKVQLRRDLRQMTKYKIASQLFLCMTSWPKRYVIPAVLSQLFIAPAMNLLTYAKSVKSIEGVFKAIYVIISMLLKSVMPYSYRLPAHLLSIRTPQMLRDALILRKLKQLY